jgi:hypothetical protein
MDQVKARWGTKAAAVDAIVGLIGDPDGRTKARLRQSRNEQLLKLWDAGQALKKDFGSREALLSAILKFKFPKGDPDETYKAKLEGYGVRRLLDMHGQLQRKAG